jgi:hypothetical protein
VCKEKLTEEETEMNPAVNLRVCKNCTGTKQEKQAEKDYLKSLAEGFVCGCI